ncbi:Progranulin [Halotydeus destructor]|nr:Progranulin [Halotydeus destructor]
MGLKFGHWLIVLIIVEVTAFAKGSTCSDGTVCDDHDSTCCKLRNGKYNCCPLKNAICCSDGFYCCPEGSTCNVKEGTCSSVASYHNKTEVSRDSNSLWFRFSEQWKVTHWCPDKSQCSDNDTCCPSEEGGYACCPYKDGVCCSDKIHCCPHGSKCDVSEGRCVRRMTRVKRTRTKSKFVDGSLIFSNQDKNVTNIVCPGGGSQCPDGNTCCKMKDGDWGCCPLSNAQCCKDQVHCCPDGYTCVDSGCKKNT